MSDELNCPFPHETIKASKAVATGESGKTWWPNNISLDALTHNNPKSNPLGEDFNYAEEFAKVNLDELKQDIKNAMTESQSWWPADWGHYGPLFIRMAWHSAGTYRVTDGRGGAGQGLLRLAPLNSWPDNGNLDKSRRILLPVKEKYGNRISWADLMILAGNVALEDMGLKTFGFAGGREDVWEADNTYWGSEISWLANERHRDNALENPLAATHMGLIYVNPEGPNGNAEDFSGSARDIRTTFSRMAMNDEETVALIAGGHAFGKAHGAGPASQVGPEPGGSPIENVGLGWINSQGKGHSEDTITSGLEGAWTPTPLTWDNKYLEILYKYEWEKVESPSGAQQWSPIDCLPEDMVPDAHIPGKMNKPMMLTTDLALRFGDAKYDEICKKFLNDFEYFSDAFARAWFKLTHRDMGPRARYLGSESPEEILSWQDFVESSAYPELTPEEAASLRQGIKGGISDPIDITDLIFTAWVSASTYRSSDKRGGANGARVMLEPMKSWMFTDYDRVEYTVNFLTSVANKLNINISVADLIVFGGNIGVEIAAKNSGFDIEVPFIGGRGDATQEQTDVESFSYLEPVADGFINWTKSDQLADSADYLLIDRASLLDLTPPEMVVLMVGLRSIGVSHGGSSAASNNKHISSSNRIDVSGVKPFGFDSSYSWSPLESAGLFYGKNLEDRSKSMAASRADLMLGSNSILRSIVESYLGPDAKEKLVHDFVSAWNKVMMLDRFDVKS